VKRIPVLPTLLTLGNGICGFAAIAYASKITLDGRLSPAKVENYFLLSAVLILAGMVFDMLDGYAARLGRCASEFGAQLDSLCDAITFGAAPAFLLLRLGQEWQGNNVGKLVAVIAAVYLACAVLRLARYNVENTADAGKRFKGLPSPAAAGCVASVAILRSDLAPGWAGVDPELMQAMVRIWAPLGALIAALLMVSRFPYPHLTKHILRGRQQLGLIVQVLLVIAVVALAPHLALFLLFWGYALLTPVRWLTGQARRRAVAERRPGLD
jgi:CDP-diacylglycerol---serine O-phosphatidyltransferase